MRTRWTSVLGYIGLFATAYAGHARGTTGGTVAEVLSVAISAFIPAAVTTKPASGAN
jgi:hypothetical protein